MGLGEIRLGEMGLGEMGLGEMGQNRSYTELLIGRVALTSFNWRTYWVVHIGAYSLNNLRLG